METAKYFDSRKRQLIYISKDSTPDFWDTHWNINELIRNRILAVNDTFVSRITRKYLSQRDGIILEGGCGWGQYVASLFNNGYKAVGIDFACNTVRIMNRFVPELVIIPGDVRRLPFHDNLFAGYWSLGVIEHFRQGYEELALEMLRVIRNNGYLFITFPYMSPLRRMKGRLGLYKLSGSGSVENFHQYALNSELVIRDFEKIGFKLIKVIPHDATTGLQHEVIRLRKVFQKLLDYGPACRWAGYIQTIVNRSMSRMVGHCILLIFKKDHRYN